MTVGKLVALTLLAFSLAPAQEPASPAPEISFTVSMSKPYTHLLEVEMRAKHAPGANVPNQQDLLMPVWTPGSYLIREYERNVQDFAATDASGRPLEWEKINKNSWRVKTFGLGLREWSVTYRVYANELTVRTSELNADHAFWNNAALLMYLDGFINAPSTLRIVPAPGWKIATGLPAVAGQPNTFRAENFDILYDSSVEVSDFKQLDFQVKWIKFYRPDENSVNSQISYYDKGALLGLLLDLEVRGRTHSARSLDDVMRYLYTEFFKKGRNYTPADFQHACELMAGASLDRFFARYVRGRDELDYDHALKFAGLRLDTESSADSSQPPQQRAYLGANFNQQGDRLMVTRVYAGAPAYEQGINAGDQIVAVDGARASQEFLLARLGEKHPGDIVHLTVFRNDDLRTFDVKLGSRSAADYRILPVAQPSDEQKRIYQAWMSAPLVK